MKTDKRICPECGDAILGRSDKKFCSDACRNSYNNKLNSDSTNYVRNINNILRKNRRILEELNPKGKTTLSKNKLTEAGLDFTYFTHLLKTKKGSVYYFCYEYGYIQLEEQLYCLVKNEKNT